MFAYAHSFNQDLCKWNVSRVTTMVMMFCHAYLFNQDLSKWDISRVTGMGRMFFYAESFNQDLSNWDVSRATGMGAMFRYAVSFNQDLSNWDVSRAVDMQWMLRVQIPSSRRFAVWRGSTRRHRKLTCSPIHLAPYRIQCVPHCQCSRRGPGMSSHALSTTALTFLQMTIAPRDCTARLANGMCRK